MTTCFWGWHSYRTCPEQTAVDIKVIYHGSNRFNHWQNTEGGGGARNEWGGYLINELPTTFFLYSRIANDSYHKVASGGSIADIISNMSDRYNLK